MLQDSRSPFLQADLSSIAISLTICIIAIFLNSVEIYLIRKGWKTVTFFEIVLLNLAIADIMASTFSLVTVSCLAYYFTNSSAFDPTLLSVFHIMVLFSVTSSVFFVILIAVERLAAIKIPLKHRAWHTSKRKLAKCLIATWVVHVILVGVSIAIIRTANNKPFPLSVSVARYVIGGYLCLGFFLAFVLYSWIAYLLLKRHSKFLTFDRTDKENRSTIIEAIQKEKASIVACVLVVVSFLGLNMPYAVMSFAGKVSTVPATLMIANSAVNPMVYFFKGYSEKYFKKLEAKLDSSENRRNGGKENQGYTAAL